MVAISKQVLRESMTSSLLRMPSSFRVGASRRINLRVFDFISRHNLKKVGLYFSIKNEVFTEDIIEKLLDHNVEVYLPSAKYNLLEFKKLSNLKQTFHGRFDIPEADGEVIDPGRLGLVIIPCLAVDYYGNRLGRGFGYYDRFIDEYGLEVMCIAYDFQLVDKLYSEAHDQKVKWIVTETKSMRVEGNERVSTVRW